MNEEIDEEINPEVSVIIPAYNAEKYIEECINSVTSQSLKKIEIILIDDKSTDKTREKIKAIQDKRITFIELEKNLGRAGAINRGLEISKGKYIAFIDSDDVMYKDRLREQFNFLEKNGDIFMVYGNFKISGGEQSGKIVEAIEFEEEPYNILKRASEKDLQPDTRPAQILDETKFIPGGSVMIRRKIFEKGILLDESLRNSEDYDLWLQIIGGKYKIAKLPILTFKYRIHENQKSSNKEKMKIAAKIINKKLKGGKYFKN